MAASLAALAVGCASLKRPAFYRVEPPRSVYANGFADHVSAAGEDMARQLAEFYAQCEAAKLLSVAAVEFEYPEPGAPETLKLDFVGKAPCKIVGEQRVGDSLWVVGEAKRSPDVVTLMSKLRVARARAVVKGAPLGQAYRAAFQAAAAQAIETFADAVQPPPAAPLKGRLTLVDVQVDQPIWGGLRVALFAHVRFAGAASADEEPAISIEEARRLRKAGDLAAAAAMLRRLIERSPATAQYYGELGDVYCDMNKLKEASLAYGMAASFDPDNPQYYLAMGQAQQVMGRCKEAERCYRKALQLDPHCVGAQAALKILKWQQQQASAKP